MNHEMIDCFQLDFTQNIPDEILGLQIENMNLTRKNKNLNKWILFIGLSIGIIVTIKMLMKNEDEKERRK